MKLVVMNDNMIRNVSALSGCKSLNELYVDSNDIAESLLLTVSVFLLSRLNDHSSFS